MVVGARIKIREGEVDEQTKPALRYGTSGVSGPSGAEHCATPAYKGSRSGVHNQQLLD